MTVLAKRRSEKIIIAALAAITSLAAVLRLPLFSTVVAGLRTGKIVWFDEAYSIFFAGHGLADVIRFTGYDSSPGLFAVLLHFWRSLAGTGVTAMAVLPFAFSLAAVPLLYLAGREFFGRRAGFVAAALTAAAPLAIKYATEIRTYSLLFCLAVLSLTYLKRLLDRGRRRDAVLWAVFSALGLYAHYTFVVFFALENAFVLASVLRREFRRAGLWLLAAAGTAASCLPLLFIFKRWGDLADGPVGSFFSRGFGHGDLLSFASYFSSLGFGEARFYMAGWLSASWSLALGALVFATLAASAWAGRRDCGVQLAAFMAFGGVVALMAAGIIYDPRYFLPYLAPAVLLAASGLARLRGRRALLAAATLLVLLVLPVSEAWTVTPALSFKYYAPYFAAEIEDREEPGDLLLLDHATDILFRLYYSGRADEAVFFPKDGRNVTDMFERFRWFDYNLATPADEATLAELTAGRRRVWTVDYYPQRTSLADPGGLKRRWFSRNFVLEDAVEFPPGGEDGQKVLLLLYVRPSSPSQ